MEDAVGNIHRLQRELKATNFTQFVTSERIEQRHELMSQIRSCISELNELNNYKCIDVIRFYGGCSLYPIPNERGFTIQQYHFSVKIVMRSNDSMVLSWGTLANSANRIFNGAKASRQYRKCRDMCRSYFVGFNGVLYDRTDFWEQICREIDYIIDAPYQPGYFGITGPLQTVRYKVPFTLYRVIVR